MPTIITMPRLTQTMDTGRLLRWLRQEGQPVAEGEPLFEVETDKAAVEVESPAAGVLGSTLVAEGADVDVGSPIAHILSPGERPSPASSVAGVAVSSVAATAVADVAAAAISTREPSPAPDRKVLRASPLAKKLAAQLGIDLAAIRGTGPDGRIDKDDVLAAAAAARDAVGGNGNVAASTPEPSVPADSGLLELSPIRRATAERMATSARETARVTLFAEVDATELMRTRQIVTAEFERMTGVKLLLNHLIIKACAVALSEHPNMLAQWSGGRLKPTREVNVGLAVAIDQGLLVPVLKGADRLNLREIALRASGMVDRARRGALSLSESDGGTFTITNLGMYDVDGFTPIINPPETAILGVGRFAEKPAVRDGRVEIRRLGALSLSFDHRVVDGAPAAAFLQQLKRLLEAPQLLFL